MSVRHITAIIQMTADLKLFPLYHQENLQNHISLLTTLNSTTHICTHRHTYRSKGGKGDREAWRVKTAERKKDRTPYFVTAELQRVFSNPAEKSLSKREAGVSEGENTCCFHVSIPVFFPLCQHEASSMFAKAIKMYSSMLLSSILFYYFNTHTIR